MFEYQQRHIEGRLLLTLSIGWWYFKWMWKISTKTLHDNLCITRQFNVPWAIFMYNCDVLQSLYFARLGVVQVFWCWVVDVDELKFSALWLFEICVSVFGAYKAIMVALKTLLRWHYWLFLNGHESWYKLRGPWIGV